MSERVSESVMTGQFLLNLFCVLVLVVCGVFVA